MTQRMSLGERLAHIAFRFVGSALFGGFIALLIFFIICRSRYLGNYILGSAWKHLFWGIPVGWGILGIFWFDEMLDLAGKVFEQIFPRPR